MKPFDGAGNGPIFIWRFVMSINSVDLMEVVENAGVVGSVEMLMDALSDYADEMSDMGLKEKSVEASEMASKLFDVITKMAGR